MMQEYRNTHYSVSERQRELELMAQIPAGFTMRLCRMRGAQPVEVWDVIHNVLTRCRPYAGMRMTGREFNCLALYMFDLARSPRPKVAVNWLRVHCEHLDRQREHERELAEDVWQGETMTEAVMRAQIKAYSKQDPFAHLYYCNHSALGNIDELIKRNIQFMEEHQMNVPFPQATTARAQPKPAKQPFPEAPPPVVPITPQGSAARVEYAQQALAEAEAALAAENDRKAYAEKLVNQRALAQATILLLDDARGHNLHGYVSSPNRVEYATFRKELQALAAEHGLKIILIGDKTNGTLVRL